MVRISVDNPLYIKINARGKQLTVFENFKSAFLENAKLIDVDLHNELSNKFDNRWTNFFWKFVDLESEVSQAHQLDNIIFEYIKYVVKIMIWEKDLDYTVYSSEGYEVIRNISSVFSTKDDIENFIKWLDIYSEIDDIVHYFNEFFYNDVNVFDGSRIKIWQNPNLVEGIVLENSTRVKELFLYAFSTVLLHDIEISQMELLLRLTSIRNILESVDKDSLNRFLRYTNINNDMTISLKQIKEFMIKGVISDSEYKGSRLSNSQFSYETQKNKEISINEELRTEIIKLENDDRIKGVSRIIGFESLSLVKKYNGLLKEDNLEIVKILLSFGYKFKQDWQGGTYFPTNKSHKSGFFRTAIKVDKDLVRILSSNTLSEIKENANRYLIYCEENLMFDNNYYAIRYPKYYIENNNKYFEFGNVRRFEESGLCATNKSQIHWYNSRSSVLNTIVEELKLDVEWDENGESVEFLKKGKTINVRSTKEGFVFVEDGKENTIYLLKDGYDKVDRIKFGISYIVGL